ncbi:MAG: electron transfer flavoprotein subunit alpha/FixB family protein, partial [Gemmatimonadetes bacterium]|nr:electron transfer flavoprotein subunit alpha/FixB family protein [Gemmatimonadota bacterium]MYA10098.1 electron transfer flavoprotein subunit alpha/FixB family protein [Gemmatimonadota bacterium]
MADVLAVAEVRAGALMSVSREVVSAARGIADALGCSVEAAACGGPG